ncbi:MAG: TonB-dependent receptor [Bacteroidota bacterium]
MRHKLILLLSLLLISFRMSSQEECLITWDYSSLTFNEFVRAAEDQYQIRFFFKDEWVKDLRPGDHPQITSLTELLDSLFRDESLFYFIKNKRDLIITKGYAVKRTGKPSAGEEQNYIAPTELITGSEKTVNRSNFYDIGDPYRGFRPGIRILSGYVTDRDTKDPVAGATIFIPELSAGTVTDEFGHYKISLPGGSYLLQFSFLGMKEKRLNVNLYDDGELDVEMNSVLIPLQETVVSAKKNMVMQRYETGVEKINMASFRLLPAQMGESDIIRNVLLMPGIKSVGEGSAGFNVRGGSSDQNLILLYGAPVYNSSHFFGFFSAVNADIINDVTLYKGGIPTRYGGRISSVLDIGTRDGNWKEFKGNAGLSPVTTHLTIETPVIKDTCTLILTGRTTYSNWLLRLIDNPAFSSSSAFFYDLNGKMTIDINRNNRIELASYLSHDSFRFNSDTTYGYKNNIIAVKWRHFFNQRFFGIFTLNNSNYRYDVSGDKIPIEGFIMSHRINSTGFKADFNMYLGRNEINYGLDVTGYNVSPGKLLPFGNSSLVTETIIPDEQGLETAVYIDDKYTLTDNIFLNAGIRFSSFFVLGPADILIYDPDYSRSSLTVIDTLSFNSGQTVNTYGGPELRISLNFRPGTSSSFKINYNRTRQYLHLMSNTTSISPTDTWKLSDYYFRPQTGDQYSAGFYKMLFNSRVETSVEAYYKQIRNMIDFKGGTSLVMNMETETDLVNVKGKAYGLEFMIRKPEGRLRWSLAYTFSRILIKSTGSFSDEIINKGKWFPANFDKPNDLVATTSFIFSRRLSFSANYTWSTGRPITYPISTYYTGDIMLIQFSERNKYRVPDYMRLDIAATLNGNLRSRKIAHPHWIFSVYNLLGRQNVYSVFFRNEYNRVQGYKISIFDRAVPSLSFNFDF